MSNSVQEENVIYKQICLPVSTTYWSLQWDSALHSTPWLPPKRHQGELLTHTQNLWSCKYFKLCSAVLTCHVPVKLYKQVYENAEIHVFFLNSKKIQYIPSLIFKDILISDETKRILKLTCRPE